MPLTIVQPGVGGTGLSTGTPLSSTTAPATNPATGTPSASTYLRGDGTWASIASTSPGGSTTQVQYNNAGAFGGDSGFVYTGGNVGVGTSSPNAPLHVTRSSGGVTATFANTATSNQNANINAVSDNSTAISLRVFGSAAGSAGMLAANSTMLYTSAADLNLLADNASGVIKFATGGTTERMRINSSGNVGIGRVPGTGRTLEIATATDYTNIIIQNTSTGSGTTDGTLIEAAGSDTLLVNYEVGNMRFFTSGTERMRIDSSGLLQFNSGYGSVATAYGCRAWVSFDGRNTPSIRGSGNVSSITDDGTGRFRVNFTTAMPDANYSAVATGRAPGTVTAITQLFSDSSGAVYSTTQFSLSFYSASDGYIDPSIFNAVVCR